MRPSRIVEVKSEHPGPCHPPSFVIQVSTSPCHAPPDSSRDPFGVQETSPIVNNVNRAYAEVLLIEQFSVLRGCAEGGIPFAGSVRDTLTLTSFSSLFSEGRGHRASRGRALYPNGMPTSVPMPYVTAAAAPPARSMRSPPHQTGRPDINASNPPTTSSAATLKPALNENARSPAWSGSTAWRR